MEERKVKLELKDMAKKYDNGDGVEHINLKVYEGEIVTFLGPSGCGKSTILRTIGGFMDVTDGDILVDGQSIVNLPPEKRPTAMVFQSYNLWPHMTIYENLAFGLKLRKVPKKEIDAEIKKMLELVSMSGFEKKYPGQLSGGQQHIQLPLGRVRIDVLCLGNQLVCGLAHCGKNQHDVVTLLEILCASSRHIHDALLIAYRGSAKFFHYQHCYFSSNSLSISS